MLDTGNINSPEKDETIRYPTMIDEAAPKSRPERISEFQKKLEAAGYRYGYEAADLALVGYDLARAESARTPAADVDLGDHLETTLSGVVEGILAEDCSAIIKASRIVYALNPYYHKAYAAMQPVPCKKCGQVPAEQSGEYPYDECGLPTMHDEPQPVQVDIEAVKRAAHKARSLLDSTLGDTDPPITDETQEEIERDYPVFAACQILSTALGDYHPGSATPMPDAKEGDNVAD